MFCKQIEIVPSKSLVASQFRNYQHGSQNIRGINTEFDWVIKCVWSGINNAVSLNIFKYYFIKTVFMAAKKHIICVYMKPLCYIKCMWMLVTWGFHELNCPSIQLKRDNLDYSSKLDCFISLSIKYSEILFTLIFQVLFEPNLDSVDSS